jgi:putative hydrolase of the HAD superfamily
MTNTTPSAATGPELAAVILDYNGVIGRQPTATEWQNLASLAGWLPEEAGTFQQAFWRRRELYDAGAISTHDFWSPLLRGGRRAPVGSRLLDTLRAADIGMWTTTDEAVLQVLRAAHAASGVPMVLLSNAPAALGDALDSTEWCATLMSKALYSARLACNKPDKRAYQAAMAAAGWPDPARTLFVDDRASNCAAAASLGLRTLHFTGDIAELARHLPQPLTAEGPAPKVSQEPALAGPMPCP